MSFESGDDTRCMDRALTLAATAYGHTSPNPMVGAVVVAGAQVVGEGVHCRAGEPHAEPQALEAALRTLAPAGVSDSNLTLYVNLEPCSHHGRTPPCIEAILASPVRRVVAAHRDPNPLVSGRGVARLREGGVRVELGCRAAAAAELNHQFIARQRRRRPFVALKVALSADDCIAAADGDPVAITGLEARRHAHRLRAGHDAILIGVETLARDRPRLDRRLYDGPGRDPRRLVLDPQLRSDPGWLWPGEPKPVLLCSRRALERRGDALRSHAELRALPDRGDGLDLAALPEALERLELWSLLVEGGGRTHAAFFEAGLWDRLYAYRNPSLRLSGLPWNAMDVWQRERERARACGATQLGGDRLEVYEHRDAGLLQAGE